MCHSRNIANFLLTNLGSSPDSAQSQYCRPKTTPWGVVLNLSNQHWLRSWHNREDPPNLTVETATLNGALLVDLLCWNRSPLQGGSHRGGVYMRCIGYLWFGGISRFCHINNNHAGQNWCVFFISFVPSFLSFFILEVLTTFRKPLLDILLTVSMLFDLVLAFYCKSGEFN